MADLQALVDQWCAENGVPCYGVDPHHKCGKSCTVLGAYPRQVRAPVAVPPTPLQPGASVQGHLPAHQICATSRQIHICPGARGCIYAVTTSEGTVCSFSGRELAGPGSTALVYGQPHWGNVRPLAMA